MGRADLQVSQIDLAIVLLGLMAWISLVIDYREGRLEWLDCC